MSEQDSLFDETQIDYGQYTELNDESESGNKRRSVINKIFNVTRGLFHGRDMKCRKCGKWGRYEEFIKKYGRYVPLCKKCNAILTLEWRKNNREKKAETDRRWYENNRDVVNAISHRRMARKRSQPNTITKVELLQMREVFNNCCAICGDIDNLENDHFYPLDIKNTNNPIGSVPGNYMLLCSHHNSSKSNKEPIQWLLDEYPDRFEYIISRLIELGAYWLNDVL